MVKRYQLEEINSFILPARLYGNDGLVAQMSTPKETGPMEGSPSSVVLSRGDVSGAAPAHPLPCLIAPARPTERLFLASQDLGGQVLSPRMPTCPCAPVLLKLAERKGFPFMSSLLPL